MIFLTDKNGAIVRFINVDYDKSAVIDKKKVICENAFREEVLQKIELQDVETIKESAFEDCKNLVVLIAGHENKDVAEKPELLIEHNAFKDCYELRDIVLLGYDKITIESGAFSGCNKLRSLVIDNAELDIRSDSLSDADDSKLCVFSKYGKNNALLEKYSIKTAKYAELE